MSKKTLLCMIFFNLHILKFISFANTFRRFNTRKIKRSIILLIFSLSFLNIFAQDDTYNVHTYVVKKPKDKIPTPDRPPGNLFCGIDGATNVYGHSSYSYNLICQDGTNADYWEVNCGYGVTWSGNYINVIWNSSTCTNGTIKAFTTNGILISQKTVTITTLPQWEDNIYYYNLYNSTNFTKTIDLSKPVGVVAGASGTTPSGGVTYSIPIYAPAGTNGNKPGIAVSYNSQGGNGVAGVGWNISGLSVISRSGKNIYHNGVVTPVTNTSDDAFLLDGMRLNPISGSNGANGTIYAGEVETYSKIISNTSNSPNNPDWFQVIAKDGSIMEFGHTTDSRILTDDGANVMLWRLNRVTDINGNYIDFVYDNTSRDSRIKVIKYTGNANTGLLPYNSITFQYKARNDKNTLYDGGGSLSSTYLLNEIIVIADNNFISRRYKLNYSFDNVNSLLKEIIETGSDDQELNSTIFLYGDTPQNIQVQSISLASGKDFFAGDFDADGKTDLLSATISTQVSYPYVIKYHSQYEIKNDIAGNSSNTLFTCNLPVGSTVSNRGVRQSNFLTGDYNGDGRDDILLIRSSTSSTYDNPKQIDDLFINYSGTNIFTTGHLPIPDLYGYSKKGNFLLPGDFDGDGNQDYILLSGTYPTYINSSYGYDYHTKAFFTSPLKNIINQEITGFGVPPAPGYIYQMTAENVARAEYSIPADFDGDGKSEVLVVKDQESYILSISGNPTTGFYTSSIQSITFINKDCKIFPGDFNGDHKTDLLVRFANGYYEILYSTGVSFIEKPFWFNESVYFNNAGYNVDDILQIGDFNGDGKSDILHGFNTNGNYKFSCYYSMGMGFYYEQYNYNNAIATGQNGTAEGFVVGDFNGDGRSDVINTKYGLADFITFKPFGKERVLNKVTDGYNNTTSFEYKNITANDPSFYERTISLDASVNQYPFNYVKLPLTGVSSVSSPNGIGGTNTTTFKYENALIHRAGKGFLGFKKITSQNLSDGITSVTENEINTQFVVPYTTSQSNYLTSTNELLSESQITTSFTDLSTANGKAYFQKTDKILGIDYLNGTASENVNNYDSYGNVVSSISKMGTLSGSTVAAVETVITSTSFGIHNTPVPALPDDITVSNQRTGMSAISATTQFSYAANGLVNSKTDFAGLPKAVTTSYTYNATGNPLTVTTSASGVSSRTINFSYDTKNRFVLTKQITGTNLLQTESSTYDITSGNPLTHTSSDCLTTSFDYDGFGRLKTTTVPEGYDIHNSLNWDIQGGNVYYSFTDFPGGSPDVKTWYDQLGRETKKQTAGFNNQWLTQLTTYDAKGNVATSTNSYYPFESPIVTTHSYDAYNRLQTVSNSLNTINTNYSQVSGGRMQVVTQDATGQTATKISDATGKTVSAIDDGGQLDYTYDSRGNQTQVAHGNTVLITTGYDTYGRQTTLVDKNAGTTSYDYDAFGHLKTQTDNNGNTYNMSYDDFGRIITRQGPEGITSYEYYKDNATGCSNNTLSKVTGFNGVVKEYTFDNLKRVQTERLTVDNTDYVTQYSYNTYSDPTDITYPSGIVVNNTYDANGELILVSGGSSFSQTTLFTGTQMDGFGHYTSYTLGNNSITQNTYTNGMPSRFYTPGIQDLNMSFNTAKGNLISRNDAVKGLTESFQYDALNRLTQSSVNGVVQLNINFDGNSSFSMGNIISKTDAGNYVYKNDKIHAVAYITNPAGATAQPVTIANTEQTIAYTPFLKTSSITEGAYHIDYTYGADYHRVKSILQQNSAIIETKIYAGNYEKQTLNGVNREVHYVSGGNGLCAMIVRENNINNFYFIYTDHLGSILTVSDINGTVVAEQNFDAWGRNRSPTTWQYANLTAVPAWLYRGYTGHEHVPPFALINMNGRMYDPIQARMLSPDNYISDPLHTQAYNRYTYAMNNPLVYKDPDGNNPLLFAALLFGARACGESGNSFIQGVGRFAMSIYGLNWQSLASLSNLGVGGGSFLGTTTCTSVTGFWAGASSAAGAGAASGFAIGFGNSLMRGNSFETSLSRGFSSGIIGGLSSSLIGGVRGGFDALSKKTNFFSGKAKLDLSRGFGAHNISEETLRSTVSGKYVGRFEDIAVYESGSLGTGAGITLPGYGITVGQGAFTQMALNNTWNLLAHEFGHVLQSWKPYVGIDGFYEIIGSESLASAALNSSHSTYWTETWANYLSHNYFSNHSWDFIGFPVQDISYFNLGKFMLWRTLNPATVPAIYP